MIIVKDGGGFNYSLEEISDDLSKVQDEVNQAMGSRWSSKTELTKRPWDTAYVHKGRAGELTIEAERDGSIKISYQTDILSHLPEDTAETASSLETRMRDINPTLPEIDASQNGISMTLEKEVEKYGNGLERYIRDFTHLTAYVDRRAKQ